MTGDPCGGDVRGGAGCKCTPPFGSDTDSRPLSSRVSDQNGSAVPVATPDGATIAQSLSFFVVGTPAPQGSKRHVGNGRMIESSAKVGPWRAAVAWKAAEQHAMVAGPVDIDITFRLARPKSASKRTYPDRKPDLDKLLRSTLDGLVEAGVIEDDARVVYACAGKLYAEPGCPTGAGIIISEATE